MSYSHRRGKFATAGITPNQGPFTPTAAGEARYLRSPRAKKLARLKQRQTRRNALKGYVGSARPVEHPRFAQEVPSLEPMKFDVNGTVSGRTSTIGENRSNPPRKGYEPEFEQKEETKVETPKKKRTTTRKKKDE